MDYGLIDYIHSSESTKPLQHPVGMTFQWQGGGDAALYASNADWISPNSALDADRNDPPVADGRKVILLDTITSGEWGAIGDGFGKVSPAVLTRSIWIPLNARNANHPGRNFNPAGERWAILSPTQTE